MNKGLKIGLNVLIFVIIAGFGWYMIRSANQDEQLGDDVQIAKGTFVSPYKKINTLNLNADILCFDICMDKIFAATNDSVSIFDLSGKHSGNFPIEKDARAITIQNSIIYLLYPNRISVYSLSGQKTGGWEACSDNSDYCSFTFSKEYVYVTDAENKNICQYTIDGNFAKFINSPDGFVIPSYSFGIININDTLYCSNSGNRKIESYTLDGNYITSFGESGTDAGAFAGCCNPVYLSATEWGDILTSEKGNPRISCYNKSGRFRSILLSSETLGGGNDAYKMKAMNNKLYIAGGKNISEYVFDPASTGGKCGDCKADCPLRKGIDPNL